MSPAPNPVGRVQAPLGNPLWRAALFTQGKGPAAAKAHPWRDEEEVRKAVWQEMPKRVLPCDRFPHGLEWAPFAHPPMPWGKM